MEEFKFCEIMFPLDVMIAYNLKTVILLLLEGYVVVLCLRSRLLLNIFHYQILWKSLLIIFGCSLCCIQMHRIRALVKSPFKFISRSLIFLLCVSG
jgi:hypothetical protein